ncbi:MAG: hypothetical protein R3Y43_04950 [Alphaproteobacteria bacterium]
MIKTEAIKKYISAIDMSSSQITNLNIDSVDIAGDYTPVYLTDLEEFANLENLQLNNLDISKKEIELLSKCKKLKSLSFYQCDFSLDCDFASLKFLSSISITRCNNFSVENLSKLNLSEISITNQDLQNFGFVDNHNLKKLRVVNCQLKTYELPEKLENLQILDLSYTPATDLMNIRGYSNLQKVYFDDEQIVANKALLLMLERNGIKISNQDNISQKIAGEG